MDAEIDAALRELFDDAIAIATRAKRAFDRKPLVKSRGVHELEPSPWFRLWDVALQGAVRLAHELRARSPKSNTLDDELDELLKRGEH